MFGWGGGWLPVTMRRAWEGLHCALRSQPAKLAGAPLFGLPVFESSFSAPLALLPIDKFTRVVFTIKHTSLSWAKRPPFPRRLRLFERCKTPPVPLSIIWAHLTLRLDRPGCVLCVMLFVFVPTNPPRFLTSHTHTQHGWSATPAHEDSKGVLRWSPHPSAPARGAESHCYRTLALLHPAFFWNALCTALSHPPLSAVAASLPRRGSKRSVRLPPHPHARLARGWKNVCRASVRERMTNLVVGWVGEHRWPSRAERGGRVPPACASRPHALG